MSMERHVFFRGKLPSKAALARTMKELGFRFVLKPATGSLESQSGYMPMLLKGEETGIEFDVFEGRSAIDEFESDEVDPTFDRSANFRWGGDETEMLVALCASAALAKITGGTVFDEEEGKLLTLDEAIEDATQHYALLVKLETVKHPGTRPADIKRYLKPLLKQRSDLVLVGRALLIRPIRHVIRGAFFDRTSDKYAFAVWPYLRPLAGASGSEIGYAASRLHGIAEVWQPHFQADLLDRLECDVFDHLGRVTSLADLASFDKISLLAWSQFNRGRMAALVLAGERERAIQEIDDFERKNPGGRTANSIVQQRAFLARDIDDICSEYHAKEAKAAEELKLGAIWEPSPFPAELPASELTARTNEIKFAITPWVTKPDWLSQDAPEKPGEIRFAKSYMVRKEGRIILQVKLTRDEAEELHRADQDYVRAERLSDGELLLFSRRTGWSPHHPVQGQWPNFGPRIEIHLWLKNSPLSIRCSAVENRERQGTLNVNYIHIHNDNKEIWKWCLWPASDVKNIDDSRTGNEIRIETELTDEDMDLSSFPVPQFGEFAAFFERIRTILRVDGYGKFEGLPETL